ncbi:sialate O-acetylesterase-like isoform X1 [Mya arenaria]|uniref:sialate O-acetylesterase-like isoform X1 n=1 Tax=Mya arenaria TaxID=6604 RepID=UPI0022E3184E|nr:sialate O-acetylesterase-like isoform X1 [Mya arenaria]
MFYTIFTMHSNIICFLILCCFCFTCCHLQERVEEFNIDVQKFQRELVPFQDVAEIQSSTKGIIKQANFSFASYYNDQMVLQGSPRKAMVWGYATNGTQGMPVLLTVAALNSTDTYKTVVTQQLIWSVAIGPYEAGGPYNVSAKLKSSVITLTDILFGDVWICSGQSNMQYPMSKVFNSTAELADTVNYPDIRVFVVNDKTSNMPLSDLSANGGILLPWTKPSPGKATHISDLSANGGILPPWSKPSAATIGGKQFTQFSAVCWLYGKYLYQQLKKPLGLVETSWGGTPVEAWSSPDVLNKCGLKQTNQTNQLTHHYESNNTIAPLEGPQEFSVLWNAMIHPLLNMSIYGAIWYQGENNALAGHHMDKYNCTFPGMIDDWRKKFHASSDTDSTFPFGFVQLAGYRPDYSISSGFPDIRWHQTADYGYVPNHRLRKVFMAVAMDLPDFQSPLGAIHPRDKQDVARRLVLGGLAVGYGRNVSFQGPYPVQVHVSRELPYNYTQVEIQYSMALTQLWLDGFEICCSFARPAVCETGKSWWLPTTTMQAYDRANVTESYASQCDLESLVGVRYAWKESPCPFKNCAIYGTQNHLPMPPFTYHGERFTRHFKADGSFHVVIK